MVRRTAIVDVTIQVDLALGIDIGSEPDATALRCGVLHEFTDSRNDRGDRFVVRSKFPIEPRFELSESPGQFFVGTQ